MMADIYRAYRLLNKALDLGLSDVQMNRVEMMMKVAWAEERGMGLKEEDVGKWEFFAELRPREEGSAPPKDFEIPKSSS